MKLAIETALAFVALPNAQAEAPPDLLQTAASYYLLNGQTREAADTWTRIGLEFPTSTSAFNGLFFLAVPSIMSSGNMKKQPRTSIVPFCWQRSTRSRLLALISGSEK